LCGFADKSKGKLREDEMLVRNNPAMEILTAIAEKRTLVGMYPSPEEAIKALALSQIEREIKELRERIAAFERKYGMTFEEFTNYLRNRATMVEEMDWEEWDDARKKLEIREKALEAIRQYASTIS